MKSSATRNWGIANRCASWIRNIVAPKAFHYVWAAYRDELNGFPYTAAMEWREAAALLLPISLTAEYCWRQWERIMRLPRQKAMPFQASRIVAFPGNLGFTARAETKSVDPVLTATAA